MELIEIKSLICGRIDRYDKLHILSTEKINSCASKLEVIEYIKDLSEKLDELIKESVLNSDILISCFGAEFLNEQNIYTDGNIKFYLDKKYIVMGTCNATAYNNADVWSYENAKVILRKKSRLTAFGMTEFQACDETYAEICGTDCNGKFNGKATGHVSCNNGFIACYEYSKISVANSRNITFYDYSKGCVSGISSVVCKDNSEIKSFTHAVVKCYGESKLIANDKCVANMFEKSNGTFNGESFGIVFSANEVMFDDISHGVIHKCVKRTKANGNCTIDIVHMGTKLSAYGHSVIKDFTDSYSDRMEHSIIIWMKSGKVFN